MALLAKELACSLGADYSVKLSMGGLICKCALYDYTLRVPQKFRVLQKALHTTRCGGERGQPVSLAIYSTTHLQHANDECKTGLIAHCTTFSAP